MRASGCRIWLAPELTINTWLEKHGLHQTRVNSRTPGREKARSVYGWGQTTPKEMATLMLIDTRRVKL